MSQVLWHSVENYFNQPISSENVTISSYSDFVWICTIVIRTETCLFVYHHSNIHEFVWCNSYRNVQFYDVSKNVRLHVILKSMNLKDMINTETKFVKKNLAWRSSLVNSKVSFKVHLHEFELRFMKFVWWDSFGNTIFRQILAWWFTFVNSKVHVVMFHTGIYTFLEKYEDPPLNLTVSGV